VQNAVVLVLDALRADALADAPFISELAARNVTEERAIAPARWSLPSHASLFSGRPPHEHGLCTSGDNYSSVPLVEDLRETGYRTYGVSANPFCSGWYGFDGPFDEFVYTLELQRQSGLGVHDFTRSLPPVESRLDAVCRYLAVLRAAVGHEHTIDSFHNIGVAGLRKFVGAVDALQRIPHPLFHSSSVYAYDPERNTRAIIDAIEHHSPEGEPFFLFSNYMDTHRPYYPAPEYQRRELGRTRSYRDIRRLNDAVAHSQRFIEATTTGTLAESDVATVRSLYTGTVAEVDDHVERLWRALENAGLAAETLLVVTADHGEDLGETGPRGERRMGHFESVSDDLLTVPLVIANPTLPARTISQPLSTRRLFHLLQDGPPADADGIVDALTVDGPVVAECPATRGEWATEYPSVPDIVVERQTRQHTVVGYLEEYKLALDSLDSEWAWQAGEAIEPERCPDALRTECEQHLAALCERFPPGETETDSVDTGVADQLADLGYM